MESEFCSESVNFWTDATVYRKTPTNQRHDIMETMYNKYIDPKGEQQVNISDAEKIHIEQRMMGDEQTKGNVCVLFDGATASSCY